jgi:uncharacterized protein (DUF433 family)
MRMPYHEGKAARDGGTTPVTASPNDRPRAAWCAANQEGAKMSLMLELPVVPITIDPHGVALVTGTRVPIDTVVTAFMQGDTPEEIAQNFPTVTVADAYAVIAYYLQHQAAVDTYLADRRQRRAALRATMEQRLDPHGLRARLLARHARP